MILRQRRRVCVPLFTVRTLDGGFEGASLPGDLAERAVAITSEWDLATPAPSDTILPMANETPRAPSDQRSAWAAAEAYGCDMSLLESALRKTPAERIRVHGRALAAALALREATERRAVGS